MTDESEHSQSDTITYDDPAGRLEREKILARLKKGCSPSPDFDLEQDEVKEGNEEEHAEELTRNYTIASVGGRKSWAHVLSSTLTCLLHD